ncbi:MAG TPA: nitrate reductase associated protein [Steroidobacteraceae bacterium]|nr:nitrate reductase associated protein [Steroidobacteraceae bacterium]
MNAQPGVRPGIFDFERDFAGSLHCIPMSVRLKLDCCGVKLSLKQWNRLPSEERHRLLELPCDSAQTCASFRQDVVGMVEARTGATPKALPIEADPAWDADSRIPGQLSAYLQALRLPPLTAAQWRGLGRLQRYALLKLSRPGHANHNFIPALREFALLRS